jgi:diacylglycerol kinase (ATP)
LKSRNLIESFNYAFEGIIHTLKTQRNMRLHFLAATVILLSSLVFKLSKLEILLLFLTIAFVIVAEMINTAVEVVVDLITKEHHPLAAIAKNVAAGAVLIAAVMAVVVGYLIFIPVLEPMLPRVIFVLRKSPTYLSLIAIMLTVVTVIVGKTFTKSGTPVQGGMPSGHAALSASAATTILFLSKNGLVSLLTLFLVFLVIESRVENKIHSWKEVFFGSLLGFFVTLLLFQIMNL